MKTFVTDDYQITLRDNGSVKVLIEGPIINIRIIYNPESKLSWSERATGLDPKEADSITDLELPAWLLKKLREALEAVGKQDLFDKEIVFVNKAHRDEHHTKCKIYRNRPCLYEGKTLTIRELIFEYYMQAFKDIK